jgi:hypothetical protein
MRCWLCDDALQAGKALGKLSASHQSSMLNGNQVGLIISTPGYFIQLKVGCALVIA